MTIQIVRGNNLKYVTVDSYKAPGIRNSIARFIFHLLHK